MTAEFLGYLGCAQSPPAQRDDAGAQDPVAWGMAASGEFVDLALLFGIFWRASVKQFRHVLFSFPVRLFGSELMYTVFEERNIRACYELGRKSHRNSDSTVGPAPSRST